MKQEPSDVRPTPPSAARRLYKVAENAIGPRLPRPLREAWRRLIGRPPLPIHVEVPPEPVALAAAPKTFDLVCFPIIAWSFRFQRPQQLMREMGRRDHRVFWIDPDSVKDGTGGGLRGELAPNVYELAIAAEHARDPFRDALVESDLDVMIEQLRSLQREAGLVSVVAIVQLPFWAPLAARAAEELGWTIVYDCMDDHAAFSTNDASMLAGEEWLLAESALVVTTSRRLRDRAVASARRTASIANACDFGHFSSARRTLPCPAALEGVPAPIIGYVGAISEWFDFDLIRHAVRAHPDWTFALVGSTWGAAPHGDLEAAPNVLFLGEQPYDALPAILARFDVTCIPFEITPLIEATDPVKLYEYQAAGKPVVASRLPELEPHASRVSLVDTPEAFTEAVAVELRSDTEEKRSERREFARHNTWQRRAADLENALEDTFPLVSVCVITWNNLDLTRACLDSVLADRSWPNVEVLIVDNASTDASPAYLRELSQREERVHVELNETNRGFAAANNQAIRRASGSYVVLLNNDTVVPRGWLSRLVRVLEHDPTVGLVGPVTDGVWNEARVDGVRVAPEAVDEFAASWASNHAGRIFPIGMLAMYCVAGRKKTFDDVGPLDERFGIGMFEDDDYAHRIRRAGLRLACAEELFIHHAGQASFDKLQRKDELWEENRTKFEQKWGAAWRAPGLGTRAATQKHRARVEELTKSSTRPPVLILAPANGVPANVEAIVNAFAKTGHTVIDVREPASEESDRTLVGEAAAGRFVSRLPMEAFDGLTGAIVLPSAGRTFDLAYLRNAQIIYLDEPDANAEARRDLQERAALVVGTAEGQLDPANPAAVVARLAKAAQVDTAST